MTPKSSDRINKITPVFYGVWVNETMKHVSCARYAANVMARHDTLKCHSFLMLQNYHFMIKGKTELSKNEVTAMFCSVSSMLTISNVTAAHHATHIGPELCLSFSKSLSF